MSAPVVPQEELNQIFKRHKSMLADFGPYENHGRAGAALGHGLLRMCPFLSDIVSLAPSASLQPGQLKAAFVFVVRCDPTMAWQVQISCAHLGILAVRKGGHHAVPCPPSGERRGSVDTDAWCDEGFRLRPIARPAALSCEA